MAATEPRWIDLVDPDEEELREHLPQDLYPSALRTLTARHDPANEPRPRIVSHGSYILGIFLVPVAVPDEDRVYYQEVDFVATREKLVSVSKSRAGPAVSGSWPGSGPGSGPGPGCGAGGGQKSSP